MQKIINIGYIIFFWFAFLCVSIIILLLQLIGFKNILRFIHKSLGVNRRILFLPSYCATNASDRYRAEKWVTIFNQKGLSSRAKYTLNELQYNEYLKGRKIIFYHVKIIIHRFFQIVSSLSYNVVIVRREILLYVDYGSLFFEKLINALHYNVFLDFDDDIQASKNDGKSKEPALFGRILMERTQKFYESFKIYNKFIAGSPYLEQLAKKLTSDKKVFTCVVPTCVDYNVLINNSIISAKYYVPKKENEAYILGWIGTNYNLFYLDIVIPYLNLVAEEYPIKLTVIAGQDYKNPAAKFDIINLKWSQETELQDMLTFDMGIMPLLDNDMERGKCGFKLIQYMGLGIVGIASAVTVNKDIVNDEEDGFLVFKQEDWAEVILKALKNYPNFNEIGRKAKKKIAEKYSFDANCDFFIRVLDTTS